MKIVKEMVHLKIHFFKLTFLNLSTSNYLNQNFYRLKRNIQQVMTFFSLLFSFELRIHLLF